MRLELSVRSAVDRPWRDILAILPDAFRATDGDSEIILYRAEHPVTGVRLGRGDSSYRIALPAFASLDEVSLARGLAEQVVRITAGTIEIDSGPTSTDTFESAFEDAVARFLTACLDLFARMLTATEEVFVIEGAHRPYYLGPKIAARIGQLERDDDVYPRMTTVIENLQLLAAPTAFPPVRRVRTPDGEVATYASWEPSQETLLPPCDYLLIRQSESTQIRIPSSRISEIVRLPGDDAVRGALLDERHWILAQQDKATIERLIDHAGTLGDRLKMSSPPPPTSG